MQNHIILQVIDCPNKVLEGLSSCLSTNFQKNDPEDVLRSRTDRGDGKNVSADSDACRGAGGGWKKEDELESFIIDKSNCSGRLNL